MKARWCTFLLAVLCGPASVPSRADDTWASAMAKARQDLVSGNYSSAVEGFRSALSLAEGQAEDAPARLETLRLLAVSSRAAGRREEAVRYIEAAIKMEEESGSPKPDEFARDLTQLAQFRREAGDLKSAKDLLIRSVKLWLESPSKDGIAELGAIDTLAVLHRDAAEYVEAEELLIRALRVREVAYGPQAAELIATVDSLAYVLFGQKKYAQAEPLYHRLLALWESSAGPEHPMVALTLDKIAEFYAAQQKYAAAEPLVLRSLTLRTNVLMASFHQTGRIELMQAKRAEARELYQRALRLGDDCKVADEVMDPLLRIQSQLLRDLGRKDEADAIDARVQAALLRKAEREGRLPSPVKPK